VRRDGQPIDVSLSVSPIRDHGGEVVGAAKIARDITESKRLLAVERELNEQLQALASELEQQVEEGQCLQEELEETNERLAKVVAEKEATSVAKTQLLATLSHELRTPLNAIAGYVDLLDMELRGPITEEQRRDLARIKRSEQVLLHLVDDVLTFAKFEAGRLTYNYERVLIDELLATLETFVAPRLAEKGLGYRVELCGADAVASIDRAKVEQILINLLSNAVKFTDVGGVRVACTVTGETIRFDVQDTGRGIPPDLVEDIFKPFVRGEPALNRTVEGTGLGLFISRELARGMDGDISVVSRQGVGSTFTLQLPRQR
jgi:signal transduction histidine kinase